jgi:hypothetical protein
VEGRLEEGALEEGQLALKEFVLRAVACHAARALLVLEEQQPPLLAQQRAFVCLEFAQTSRCGKRLSWVACLFLLLVTSWTQSPS